MNVAVVTGSTKGIGKAIALSLLENKKELFVILNYAQDDDTAKALSIDLDERYPKRFAILKADLSTETGLNGFLSQIQSISKTIDILIINAAITNRKPFEALTMDEWNTVINTNLTVPFFLTQQLYPKMNPDGRILFIGSILGEVPHSLSIPYGVTKAGIHMLARMLVKETRSKNITVNAIAPGFVETDWQKAKGEETLKRISEKIALHRFAYPQEIAQLALNVLDNAYLNGSVITIDGGYDYQ